MEVIFNGKKVEANKGETILELAVRCGEYIPTLCYLKDVIDEASCRICMVEANGRMVPSCATKVSEGMNIVTRSQKIHDARKTNLELIISNHDFVCGNCPKSGKCKLQELAFEYGIDEKKYAGEKRFSPIDESSPSIVRNNAKCILCNRCTAICRKIHGIDVFGKNKSGFNSSIDCAYCGPINSSECVGCGQCVMVCPTGALMEHDDTAKVINLLNDPEKTVVCQIAPAVRVALSEEFGYPMGTFEEGKMVTALKRLGFDAVYDVNMGADFTVLEESKELIERIQANKNLPQFTSCCPAWFDYVHKMHPEFINNLSECKSPSEMLAPLTKFYYKNMLGKDVTVVNIMPCTAKKHELIRCEGVDVCLTTREVAKLIKAYHIDYANLEDSEFDAPFGKYSGAGLIFGVTGGVTEAALRTAIFTLTGKEVEKVEEVRTIEGIKEVNLTAGDLTLNIAIASGLKNAETLLQQIKDGKKYHFIEVMACPGGCNNGGGQPYYDKNKYSVKDVVSKRGKALLDRDSEMKLSTSHNNEEVKKIYDEWLKGDNSPKNMFHDHK